MKTNVLFLAAFLLFLEIINAQNLTMDNGSLIAEDGQLTLTTTSPLEAGIISLNSGDLEFTVPGFPGGKFVVGDDAIYKMKNENNNRQMTVEVRDDGRVTFYAQSNLGGTHEVMTFDALDGLGSLGLGTNEVTSELASLFLHIMHDNSSRAFRIENDDSHFYYEVYVDNLGDYVWDSNTGGAFIDKNDSYNYKTFSDQRLKTGIEPIGPVLDGVLNLIPSKYYFRGTVKERNKSLGFIAQDVESVFPGLITEKDGYKSLAYDNFGVLAIKAIQEQQVLIESLKTQVDELISLISDSEVPK